MDYWQISEISMAYTALVITKAVFGHAE